MGGAGVDEAVLQAACAAADVHPLLCAVAHRTGDLSLLREAFAPDQDQLLVPGRGLGPEEEAAARAAAAAALSDHLAAGRPDHALTADERRRIYGFLVGAKVAEHWDDFLTEELALHGSDPRRPSWRLQDIGIDASFRCAVIGAGASGVAAAHRLRQAGVTVTVFEKNDDVGGTWLENVYPGCRVDVPNQLYSFSFAQTNDWMSRFSAQPDLLAYLQETAKDLGLGECIRFDSEVTEARFDDAAREWSLTVRARDGSERTEVVDGIVCAVGQLNRPSFPALAGQDSFAGPSFHSAAWDDTVELAGRRVGVIGTGASAAQFVPYLAGEVAHLDVFQRTPPWLLPTDNYGDPFPSEFHDLLRVLPSYGRWDRLWQFWLMHEGLLVAARVDPEWDEHTEAVSAGNDFVRSMLLDVLRSQVEDDALFEKMVPHFPPFAKRALRDDGRWAAALSRSDVDLVTTPIAGIAPDGVRTEDGVEHPADVLIYGTGFSASDFVAPMRVFGAGGVELSEEWGGDAQAYLGLTVPGFPNFFLLYGPNTNLVINGSILIMVECQVRYAVEAIGQLLRGGHRTMSCRRDVHERYGREMEEGNALMVWGVADVPTWYRNARGRVTQNWPFDLHTYWDRTREPDLADYELG
ncbi:MAG TPA: NAD(P)/FAD-dependent oxidoreductase [Acidimicrobiales bacterium]|jgi:4-hydroxyacetophenone monooxygenase|nr:NAD(P)/FAD-dependent oxidoreductase [Acidimicrobiales bacterium]